MNKVNMLIVRKTLSSGIIYIMILLISPLQMAPLTAIYPNWKYIWQTRPDFAPQDRRRGYLTLSSGPMFTQKSSTLLHIARQVRHETRRAVILINFRGDTRYGSGVVATHDGDREMADISVTSLDEADDLVRTASFVLVDEAHLINRVVATTDKWLESGVDMYVNMLEVNAIGRPFDVFTELRLMAHRHIPHVGLCSRCPNVAVGSIDTLGTPQDKRDDPSAWIGGPERYYNACADCWRAHHHPPIPGVVRATMNLPQDLSVLRRNGSRAANQ